LDRSPEERWHEIATDYADRINYLIQGAKDFLTAFLGTETVKIIEDHLGKWNDKLPQPYSSELRGISASTNLPLGDIVLYNIFYEIFTVCTSIIAQDQHDQLYHARNLDFGVFLGWNETTHDWSITERLRNNIINIEWKKDGKVLYKSVNFAGFIGVYNGIKPQRFTITANERFDITGGYIGILKWLLGDTSASWMTLLVRDVLETIDQYDQAVEKLSNTKLMAPVYYIVGGNSSGQGSIIVRSLDGLIDTVRMNLSDPNGWYLLETNYDPKKKPLFIDDRRTPGNKCMQKLGRKNVGFEGIFNVLSSTTNLNKLTTYTTLMEVNSGKLETYIQKCSDPCWPW